MVNKDGTVEYVNRKHPELMGYDLADIPTLEQWWSQAYPDETDRTGIRAAWNMLVQSVFQGEKVENVERRVVCKDGSVKDLELRITAAAGKIIVAFDDITERKKTEEVVRKSRELLNESQRLTHIGSWELELKTQQLIGTDEFFRIFGLRPGESQLTFEQFIFLLHPDDRPLIPMHHRETLKTKMFKDLEYRARMSDGSVRHIHARGKVHCDGAGAPVRVVGTVRDITDDLEKVKALRIKSAAIESACSGIVMADDTGLLLYANRAFLDLWGYGDPSEVLGMPAAAFTQTEEQAEGAVRSLMKNGRYIGEIKGRKKDGSFFDVHFAGSVVRDSEGNFLCLVGSCVDVTERKSLEREMLEIDERERIRIGQDTHDGLGQVLAAISYKSGVLERLLATHFPSAAGNAAELKELITMAKEQTQHIVRGLIPVEKGDKSLMIALEHLTTGCARLFDVSCEFICKEDVSIKDHDASLHLYRIAQEAITNAVKHGKPRRIIVSLDKMMNRITLTITDDGSGLGPLSEGSMGTRIMRYRSQLINADLSVESRLGGGAVVTCIYNESQRKLLGTGKPHA